MRLSASLAGILLACAVASAAVAGEMKPKVKLSTTLGDIVLELDAGKAPVTVDNFIKYVQAGHYNGLIFHRVIANFMIQGGGYTEEMDERKEGLRKPIKNEWENGLTNEIGTIAMARTQAPDSATAQFFINVADNDRLDQPISGGAGYCVFGKVVEGMDVVEKIRDTEVTTNPKLPMGPVVPTTPVVIKSATVLGDFDASKLGDLIKQRDAARAAEWREKWPDDVKAFVAAQEKELGTEATLTPSGLAYFVLKEGSGETPKPTSRVLTHYTGTLVDGTKFDSSFDHPGAKPYPVNMRGGVIKGWLEALATMKTGEKRKIILPPKLAYGRRGSPPKIGPNAYLVFDVEIVEIK